MKRNLLVKLFKKLEVCLMTFFSCTISLGLFSFAISLKTLPDDLLGDTSSKERAIANFKSLSYIKKNIYIIMLYHYNFFSLGNGLLVDSYGT